MGNTPWPRGAAQGLECIREVGCERAWWARTITRPRPTRQMKRVRRRLLASRRLLAAERQALAHQRAINGRLQHVILPALQSASELNGMRIAARCLAADQTVQVGGDWYLTQTVAPTATCYLLSATSAATGWTPHPTWSCCATPWPPSPSRAASLARYSLRSTRSCAGRPVARSRPRWSPPTGRRAGSSPGRGRATCPFCWASDIAWVHSASRRAS
jgi:hypothetical protein